MSKRMSKNGYFIYDENDDIICCFEINREPIADVDRCSKCLFFRSLTGNPCVLSGYVGNDWKKCNNLDPSFHGNGFWRFYDIYKEKQYSKDYKHRTLTQLGIIIDERSDFEKEIASLLLG